MNNRIGCLFLVMCLLSAVKADPNRIAKIDRRLEEAKKNLAASRLRLAESKTKSALKLTRRLDVGEGERIAWLIEVSNMYVKLGKKDLAFLVLRNATEDLAKSSSEPQSNLIGIFTEKLPLSPNRCRSGPEAFDPCCWNPDLCEE